MKKELFLLASSAVMLASCTGNKNAGNPTTEPTDSLEVKLEGEVIDKALLDWDESNAPLSILGLDDPEYSGTNYLFHIVTSAEDSARVMQYGKNYSLLYSEEGKCPISFDRYCIGKDEKGSIIGDKWISKNCGAIFKSNSAKNKQVNGFALTQDFINSHEILEVKKTSENFEYKPAPKSLLDQLTTRYGGKIADSKLCGTTTDGTVNVYSVQFQPVDTFCMAMRVITEGDSLYVLEEPTYQYEEFGGWHADDGGEYLPIQPSFITRSDKGMNVYYIDYAPESITYSALLVRDGKVIDYDFACYYVWVDYNPEVDPAMLPQGAVLKDEKYGWKVWTSEDIAPSEENEAGQYSVYYSKPGSEEVYMICITNQHYDYKWENNTQYVDREHIMGGENAYLVKSKDSDRPMIIIDGCPDARNMFSYLVSLPIYEYSMVQWIPTNSGFQGVDEEKNLLKFANYQYHDEGGRYEVIKYFDFNGSFVSEDPKEALQ